MEWKQMYPKNNQPSVDDIADYIGGVGKKLWTALIDYMDGAYAVKPKLFYSVCAGKPGWNVKFQKSGQSFGTLYPEKGFFQVLIVISYKHDVIMEMIKSGLSPKMCERYDRAQDYMKVGKWMMFPIHDETDLNDYKNLMSVKMRPKNR